MINKKKESYLYAIRLLAKRDYSIFKMKNKLLDKGFELDDAMDTIKILLEAKYLREDEYIRQRVRGLFFKFYSSRYILQKLKQEEIHLSQDQIDDLKNEWELDEDQIALDLIEKKTRHLTVTEDSFFKYKVKISRFLESKGFQSDLYAKNIDRALNHLID